MEIGFGTLLPLHASYVIIAFSRVCQILFAKAKVPILAHISRTNPNQPIPFYELELGSTTSNLIHICVLLEKTFRLLRILRCYPGGIYIMMSFKIFESFVKVSFFELDNAYVILVSL